MYVVDRDFGFAPNPFHGCCTLATCMPRIRAKAQVGDWVVGLGGARLKATGRCIYAMRVTETMSFNEYWVNKAYFDKRPVRNGSSLMMVGDNIYHRDQPSGQWQQVDSHHSNPDGTPNPLNVNKDTSVNRVLVSRDYFYFGRAAPPVAAGLLAALGYKNGIGHRVFDHSQCSAFLQWLFSDCEEARNIVVEDPFDFDQSEKRYSGKGSVLR
jgi:Nucleotide modification associated domain 2